jgi:sphinganine-1-phosphate aldolase
MDTHKYGYAPKGSSVIMYSDPLYRHYQYYTTPDWTGGIYATPGLAGSRPGALVAVTWATLMRMGSDGYEESVRGVMETASMIRAGVSGISGVCVLGSSELSVVCIGSDDAAVSVYAVSDCMGKRGWNLNSLQHPACFHICCTHMHKHKAQLFLNDLADAVDTVRSSPGLAQGAAAAMYGMAGSLPDSSLVGEAAKIFLDVIYEP